MVETAQVSAMQRVFQGFGARAGGPTKLLVFRTADRQPDLQLLEKLTGQQIRQLPIREFITALYLSRSASKRERTWHERISALQDSNAVVLLGPVEDLIFAQNEHHGPAARQLQLFLCNLTNLLHPGRNNIIFFTKQDPRRFEFAVDTLTKKFRIAKILLSELDVSDEYWSDKIMKTKSHGGNTALSAELRAMVSSALKKTQIKAASNEREKLADELSRQVEAIVSRKMSDVLNTFSAIDAESGLPVPPAPRANYAGRKGELAALNAPEFLKYVWGDYLQAKLLYTGHLKKADPSLYNAIIYLARQTARGVAELTGTPWSTSLTHQVLFEKFGLISETQLDHPPKECTQSIDVIRRAIDMDKVRPIEILTSKIEGVLGQTKEL